MSRLTDLGRLEELVVNSAPSRRELFHDGWLVRLSHDDVKRARSVTAFQSSDIDLENKVAWCERLFLETGLPPLFRVSPASRPATLDEFLAGAGYVVIEPTLVQVLNLTSRVQDMQQAWQVSRVQLEPWVDSVASFRGSSARERDNHAWRMASLQRDVFLAGAFENGEMIGSGAVIIEEDYAGVLDMHTREDYRGRGVGSSVLQTLISYACSHDASVAWLGVLAANAAALGLYDRFGFKTAYSYWYRQRLV